MDPRKLFTDARLGGLCVYCGDVPASRDHCPSKVLLDEPFPPNMRVVEACVKCNSNFSLDEQYVACFIEAILCGSAVPGDISRPNVKRILTDTPGLMTQLMSHRKLNTRGEPVWEINDARFRRIVLKLARGHIAYELGLPKIEEPDIINFSPLILMSDKQVADFEFPSDADELWPEIGSRAFMRAVQSGPGPLRNDWITVQPERYRFLVGQSKGNFVHMVLSEYLACQVIWN
jgi:hypothetical protein